MRANLQALQYLIAKLRLLCKLPNPFKISQGFTYLGISGLKKKWTIKKKSGVTPPKNYQQGLACANTVKMKVLVSCIWLKRKSQPQLWAGGKGEVGNTARASNKKNRPSHPFQEWGGEKLELDIQGEAEEEKQSCFWWKGEMRLPSLHEFCKLPPPPLCNALPWHSWVSVRTVDNTVNENDEEQDVTVGLWQESLVWNFSC